MLEVMFLRFTYIPAHREHGVSFAWMCYKTDLSYIFQGPVDGSLIHSNISY